MFWQRSPEFQNWLPRFQAHRGWWTEGLAQNTLPSIQAAFEKGFKMVEFDVRLTSDGEVILFHDERINGKIIREHSFVNLKKELAISTLDEVLSWLCDQKNENLKLNIELKSKYIFNSELERKVSRMIQRYEIGSQVMVSSFNPLALARFRFYSPEIYRALIQSYEDDDLNNWLIRNRIFNILIAPHVLNLRAEDFQSEKFKRISALVPIVLWTVNEKELYFRLKDQVFGIISDKLTPDTK